jgi:mRNA-degrading endonuclease RelE of RelBE toxin-antitoxin system
MKLSFTKSFIKDYQVLPANLQKAADKQLERLAEDPQHPSLNVKKMQDPRNIWEARVTKGYRLTFQLDGEICILRRLGTHDILRTP